ncbi:uncharacterized protein LOC127438152 [Myxocyprinus asiaticus]|uniref:uncharacterized protein LOC127438152 n=1 Tax=Myxocyprinus asiaticus TaxID=70543 RepID=UPI002222B541|nr:uncharacterized protein LOC127438152 [Myxocyprinus asiaticus]
MCSMKCNLKKKLILFSFMLHFLIKVECDQVNGTTGGNVNITFTFQDPDKGSLPKGHICLHKNENKIENCHKIGANSTGSGKFLFNNVDNVNNAITLSITNLTIEDKGIYHVVLHNEGKRPLIPSNKIYLTVKLVNKSTENMPTSVNETTGTAPSEPETSKTISISVFLTASFIICICLFFVGLLFWFYRTCPRKSDNLPVQNNSTTQQGGCGTPRTLSVSCVEYGELDFQHRPERHDRGKPAELTSKGQDGVEYAAIIFPQQKQTPSGRMRDIQQVAAIR